MARYKHIDTSPRFIAVDLQRQLLPGTFEHAMNYLLDHQIELTGLDAKFCNDATGAAAMSPDLNDLIDTAASGAARCRTATVESHSSRASAGG